MKFHSACQGQKTPPSIDIYPDKASEFIVPESIYIDHRVAAIVDASRKSAAVT
jgi:hypothetical protein